MWLCSERELVQKLIQTVSHLVKCGTTYIAVGSRSCGLGIRPPDNYSGCLEWLGYTLKAALIPYPVPDNWHSRI